MKTFEKEINWVTWEFDADKNETVETPHTKTATFNELNRTDKRQHELHFMLVDIFEGTAKANGEVDIDSFGLNPKGLLKITVKAIEDLLTDNESFTKADKEVTHFLSIVKQGKAIKSGWDGIFGSAPTQHGNQNGPFSVKKSLEKK